MKKTLIVLSALTMLAAGAANAKPSQASELRGFQACIEAAKAEFTNGFVSSRTYFINRERTANTYYINASAWQDGDHASLRISCETTRNGRDLLAYNAAPGRFVLRSSASVQVAGNQ